jgi:hypothetical protein
MEQGQMYRIFLTLTYVAVKSFDSMEYYYFMLNDKPLENQQLGDSKIKQFFVSFAIVGLYSKHRLNL